MKNDDTPAVDPTRLLIGQRLAQVRELYGKAIGAEKKLTQSEFCHALGISGDRAGERWGHYERGTREPPMWVLTAIRAVTGYSLDYILCGLPPGKSGPVDLAETLPPSVSPTQLAQGSEHQREQVLLAIWRELDDDDRRTLLRMVETLALSASNKLT